MSPPRPSTPFRLSIACPLNACLDPFDDENNTRHGTRLTARDLASADHKEALLTLLRSFLLTHLGLVDSLTRPPADYLVWSGGDGGGEGAAGDVGGEGAEGAQNGGEQVWRSTAQDQWEHLRHVCLNMQHLINEVRPRQVCLAPPSSSAVALPEQRHCDAADPWSFCFRIWRMRSA